MGLPRAWIDESGAVEWVTHLSRTVASRSRSWWRGGRFGRWARELLGDWRNELLATGGLVGVVAVLTNVLWLVVLRREVEPFGIAWRLLGLLLCGIGVASRADSKMAIRTSFVLRWFQRR